VKGTNTLIFRTVAAVLLPVILLLSVVVLLRGHNAPGGGFVGGLLAAAAFSLHALAFSSSSARALLRVDPRHLIAVGLLAAVVSGVPALAVGGPYMEGLWASVTPPGGGDPIKLGTPLLFDIGVYLLVFGGSLLMILSLEET